MDRNELNQRLPDVIEAIVRSVRDEPRMQHLNGVQLPSRDVIIECIDRLRQVLCPGYFGSQGVITTENVTYRIGELVIELAELLYGQVLCCLRYQRDLPGSPADDYAGGTNGDGDGAGTRAACA